MRKELKKLDGERDLFVGIFVRAGVKNGYKGSHLPTLLFKEVRRVSDNKLMCGHLWLNKTKAFAALNLSPGVQIQFAARVKQYTKGYLGKNKDIKKRTNLDYRLSHPTQVKFSRKNETITESKIITRRVK